MCENIRFFARVYCSVSGMTPPTQSFVVGLVVAWFLSVVLAVGSRPVPFRTRKLSPPAPMVLHSGGCGRVGRRRHIKFIVCVGRGCLPPCCCGGGWLCPTLFTPMGKQDSPGVGPVGSGRCTYRSLGRSTARLPVLMDKSVSSYRIAR